MKILKYLYLVCFFFALPFVANGQMVCEAPPPNTVNFIGAGPTYLTVDWTPVPGAVKYRVSAILQNTGTVVETNSSVTTTTYTFSGLLPGEIYEVTVQASYCDDGPFGQSNRGEGATTIIIQDIVLQMNCNESSGSAEEEYEVDETSSFIIPANSNECYFLTGKITSVTPTIRFSMAFINHGHGKLEVIHSPNSNPKFDLAGNEEFLEGLYNLNSTTGNWKSFFSMSPKWVSLDGDLELIFLWKEDVNLTITACNECEFTSGNNLQVDLSGGEISELEFYPNPAKNHMKISFPSAGQLEILDVMGRHYYTQTILEQGQVDIFVNHLPKGSYVLRWQTETGHPLVRPFIKIE